MTDPCGPAIEKADLGVLIISKETYPAAVKSKYFSFLYFCFLSLVLVVNELRALKGFKELDLKIVDLVSLFDHVDAEYNLLMDIKLKISSSTIREYLSRLDHNKQ